MRISQINFDGVDLISSQSKFYIDGLLDIEKEITINETYDGYSYNSSKIKSKKLALNGYLFDTSFSFLSKLNSLFSANRLHKISLNIDYLGEVYCYAEIENVVKPKESRKMSIKLIMVEPYLYSINPIELSLGTVSNNGIVFPLTFPVTFGTTTGAEAIINNIGNTTAYPVITVVGACSNISVTNQTTNESMNLNVNLGANDVLVIDNRPSTRSIWLNGTKRMDLKSSGGWISCISGDNTFIFQRVSNEIKQHCTINLQSRYI